MRIYRSLFMMFLAVTIVVGTISGAFIGGTKTAAAAIDPLDFIKGADISTLQAIEDAGGKYFDNGVEKDLLDILKDHGVNYIRLRVWNNPVQAGADPNGVYYNDKKHLVELAQRVKSKGLKLLVDFHYSDFWADPGAQVKPEEWVQYTTIDGLKGALYNYTTEVLESLKEAGAYPDMVQIGNEINPGMLLKNKESDSSTAALNGANSGTGANLVALIKEGVRAVRDVTPAGASPVKIMIHVAHSWSSSETTTNNSYITFYDRLRDNSVDFDVIGLSYYPYWHGSYKVFKNDMNFLSARYNKDVVIAETAHPYTLEDGDGWENIANQTEADANGFPASPAGQKAFMETMMNMVATVNDGKGLGIFYWEPAWIPVPKKGEVYQAGWKVNEGNAWDNQAFFDFHGNALPSLDAFRFLPGDLPVKEIAAIYPVQAITTNVKVKPELPSTVSLVYNDGDMSSAGVTWNWNESALDKLKQIGTFKLYGTVEGTILQASINITTNPSVSANLVLNPGFETSTGTGNNVAFTNWIQTGTSGIVSAGNGNGNIHSGSKSVSYYKTSAGSFSLKQTINNLTPGKKYVLKVWSSGDAWTPTGSEKLQLFAENPGGIRINQNMINYAWNDWHQYSITEIVPTGTSMIIGLDVTTPAGNKWGVLDDIEFYEFIPIAEWGVDKIVTAANIDPTSVSLNWSGVGDSANVAGYKVYQNGELIASDITDPSYLVTGLSPKSTYTFKVEASYGLDIWTSTGPTVTLTIISKAELADKIAAAQTVVEATYTPETWSVLQAALTVAISVNANTEASQASIDEAAAALQAAIDGLIVSSPSSPQVSKAVLADKITAAQTVVEATYTAETWSVLQAALTVAISVNANAEASQATIDEAAAALQAAMDGLKVRDNGNSNNPDPQPTTQPTPQPTTQPTQPTSQPTVNVPVSPGILSLTALDLAPDPNGKVRIQLAMDTKEVKLPSRSSLFEALKTMELQSDTMSLSIPSKLFKQLSSQIAKEDIAGSSISVTLAPLSKSETEKLISQSGIKMSANVKAAGQVYDFNLAITTANGAVHYLNTFSEPMILRLKVAPEANLNITGVYYISDDGKLEYVEGQYLNGEMVVSIKHFSKYAVLEVKKTFNDVPESHWAAKVIAALSSRQLINGTSDTSFEPKRNITRAEFTMLLVNALKLTETGAKSFADVPNSAWYAQAISKATQAGIVNGKSETIFDPGGLISREEMVTMLMKAYSWKNPEVSLDAADQNSFADKNLISLWAREYVLSAYDLKLIHGKGEGMFAPKALSTRAEAAQIIYNLLQP